LLCWSSNLVLHYCLAFIKERVEPAIYITVAAPKSLRNKLGNSIRRKVWNTHEEAIANRSKVEVEVQRQIGKELNQLSIVEEVQEIYQENTLSDLPKP
tara:strand:- start:341 stop:634 length:294 start_codon:yes stop_codon:yes gene_type:complete